MTPNFDIITFDGVFRQGFRYRDRFKELLKANIDESRTLVEQKPYRDAIEYLNARREGEPKSTAYHEAGHAVACLNFGLAICELTIGDRSFVRHAGSPNHEAVISAAGPIAHLAYCQQSGEAYVNGSLTDYPKFVKSCRETGRSEEYMFEIALAVVTVEWLRIEKLAEFMLTLEIPFSLGPRAIALVAGIEKEHK